MAKTIVALFNNYRNAESAAKQIKEKGLKTEDISIILKEDENGSDARGAQGNTIESKRNDDISDGVVTGGILGGLAGLLIGAGSLVVPGLGIIAAAGPIAGLISGAITGGVVGGLIDLGIPEEKSKEYEHHIKSGKVLFSMKSGDEKVDSISSVLKDCGAESVDSY